MGNEGIKAGMKIRCRVNRTLDEGDFSFLHSFTWFNMPVHCDAEYGKKSWFGERSLAAPCIFVVADGLVHCGDNVSAFLEQYGFFIYAYVGVENVRVTRPVMFGDTLRAEAEVADFRTTKNPDRCVFSYTNKTYNQKNELVIEYTTSILVAKLKE